MVKFFNLHDDIGNDIYDHRETQPNRLDEYHYPRMSKGGIDTTAIVCCFTGDDTWEDMMNHVLYVEEKIAQSNYFSYDYDKTIRVFIALEGMCGIKDNAEEKIQWLYAHHVRLASLCWNERNELACGAKTANEPLRALGIACVKAMNEVGMAIDCSHCSEWNFYDLNRVSTTPIIATHSNVKGLFNHYRNLSDSQIQTIGDRGGLIGAIPVRWFVTRDESKQTMDHFIDVLDYIKEKIGLEHVALGFDFMDYMGDETCMIKGINSVAHIQNLATALAWRNYTQEEIEAICFGNANRFMTPYLVY